MQVRNLQLGGDKRCGSLLALERLRQLLDARAQLPPLARQLIQLPCLRDPMNAPLSHLTHCYRVLHEGWSDHACDCSESQGCALGCHGAE